MWSYVAQYDSIENADSLIECIENTVNSLSQFPERGHIPHELERINISNFREVHFKPYRIIL
ncbi:MAG: type II toxin-antitoxin system RelE/ParE family toxin [Verrucomicrobiota bacterium]|nr:type II toxin-antitoxin system RelE/ParE family toxin [Verrucomicrobiota bacterium]